LIELMIAVAIVAILASIATPLYTDAQLRARRSEVFVNLKGIAEAQAVHYQLYEDGVRCEESPTTPLGRQAYEFDDAVPGWQELAWEPDGKVRCHYAVDGYPTGLLPWGRAVGTCDLDGDGFIAGWWIDLDPLRVEPTAQHMVLRPNPATEAQKRF